MTPDDAVLSAASRALGHRIATARSVPGGDINDAWELQLDGGERAFLKSRAGAPEGEYAAEAAGLAWLGEAAGLPVPEVLAVVEDPDARGLVLTWVEEGRLAAAGEVELGRGLATVHGAGAPRFGALPPGSPPRPLRFGSVEIDLDAGGAGDGWPGHYGRRIEGLARTARDAGAITARCAALLGSVVSSLDSLAGPAEPPARVHGDLWRGNVLAGADGRPWLIDPAAHGAHRELDLAMLDLFGSVPARALAAYQEVRPLADGWRDRIDLWQVQPLLVHALLFGGSYGAAVERIAARWAPA